jgi:hypothetical protein
MLFKAKSKKNQNLLRNRAFRNGLTKSTKPNWESRHSAKKATDNPLNSSVLTNFSTFSRNTTNSKVIAKEGNLLEFLDREIKLTKYVDNWRVVDSQPISYQFSIQFIKNIKENFFLNLKNYWFKNLGKYYLTKFNNKRQFFYVCNALHPKYLARKYFSFGSSDIGILNYLFIEMGVTEQILISKYIGKDLTKVKDIYTDKLLQQENSETIDTLKMLWDQIKEKDESIIMKSQFSSDASHEHFHLEKSNKKYPGLAQTSEYPNISHQLETITEEKHLPKNRVLNHLLKTSENKEISLWQNTSDVKVSEHSPDHLINLGTPFSHIVPLIKSPLNGSNLPNSQLIQLISNLGLGINLQNFSDQNILFVVKDYGILPVIDFLEMILQIRIKHLKKIMSVMEDNGNMNTDISCYKINEEKCQIIKNVLQGKSKKNLKLDFSALSLECFDDEYFLSFANCPQFSLYWEHSDSFRNKNISKLLNQNENKNCIESVIGVLGLKILNEFQVVNAVIKDLLNEWVERSSTQNGITDHLAECDQYTISLKSSKYYTQWSEFSSSTRMRNQGNQFISSPNIERIGRNSMLKNIVISSKSDCSEIIQKIPNSCIRTQKNQVKNFNDVKESVFGANGIAVYDKVCFSGNDNWINKTMKGLNTESINVKIL